MGPLCAEYVILYIEVRARLRNKESKRHIKKELLDRTLDESNPIKLKALSDILRLFDPNVPGAF